MRQRLLERIRYWESNPGRRAVENRNVVIDSIAVHLQKLLNLKKGTTLIDDELGLPDLTDLAANFPESARKLSVEVAKMIRDYEPRLEKIYVNFAEHNDFDLELYFQITAKVKGESIPFFLNSKVDSNRRMRIVE
jgi:type VI secretion system protein